MILVIDDNDQERALIRKMLEADGHDVREAAGGTEGVALVAEQWPDLVLCDLLIPDKDGFETMREIHAHNPAIKIVAMSGVLSSFAEPATLRERFNLAGVLEKPFRHAQLLDVVRQALEARQGKR